MLQMLRETQPSVKRHVGIRLNDAACGEGYLLRMAQVSRIHVDKAPRRIHFIVEWMDKRGLRAADIARATGADKGTISRWINDGAVPRENYLQLLADVLQVDEPAALFRHPDDDWLTKLFKDRSEEERERMLQTLEAAFPRRVA